MQRLPAITSDGASWRLPLAEHVAAGLADALLIDCGRLRTDRIASLMRDDPALAVWAACRAAGQVAAPPTGVGELAHWLAQRSPAVFRWSSVEAASAADDAARKRRWSQLTWAGVASARIAARLAAQHTGESEVDAERAYLLGLLHGAVEWLAASRPSPARSGDAPQTSCLPNWLLQVLHELDRRSPSSLLGRVVLAASDLAAARADDVAAKDEFEEHRAYAETVRGRWMAEDDLAEWAPGFGAGGILVRLIDKLTRLEQLERDFASALEQEKLAALQQLAYGASHEINNPLANISTRAQTLLRDETNPERRRKLATINSQAFRAHEMIADLMLFAKPPRILAKPVELISLIDRVIGELAVESQEQGTTISRTGTERSLVIQADAVQLAMAIKAMCVNSLEAIGVGGRIEISAAKVDQPLALRDPGCWARIAVCDTGPGIPPDVRRHLFDPYYSGREAGRGLGLGLSKCWTIVSQHGGRIEVESGAGPGATFVILLPCQPSAAVDPGHR